MSVIDAYQDFAGGAVELAECAVKCGAGLGWTSVDPDRTNERLVRYYVTDGVIGRPDRVGRDAVYQFRHLVQLLNARRLSEKGVALSVIGDYNRRAKTQDLRAGLERPAPTEAELLVRIFKPAVSAGLTMGRLLFVMWRKPFSAQAKATKPLDGNLDKMS